MSSPPSLHVPTPIEIQKTDSAPVQPPPPPGAVALLLDASHWLRIRGV